MYGYSLSIYYLLANYLYEKYILPVYRFFVRVADPFSRVINTNQQTQNPYTPETVSSLSEKYIARQTAVFLKTFHDENVDKSYNDNIDAVFYSQKELTETLKDEANELEKKWRTKILFETTPRGNIVMFYDAYKQGFTYYADQTGIPYNLLNAVSMKYVIVFRCRDFFIDETVLPIDRPSGITFKHALERTDVKNKMQTKTQVLTEKSVDPNQKSAFAKFKSYNSVSAKANGYTPKSSENVSLKSTGQQTVAPKMTNKHISMGKISNFSFLQKNIVKHTAFESDLLPKKRMSYADYKRLSN